MHVAVLLLFEFREILRHHLPSINVESVLDGFGIHEIHQVAKDQAVIPGG